MLSPRMAAKLAASACERVSDANANAKAGPAEAAHLHRRRQALGLGHLLHHEDVPCAELEVGARDDDLAEAPRCDVAPHAL